MVCDVIPCFTVHGVDGGSGVDSLKRISGTL